MPTTKTTPDATAQLRLNAEQRLKAGTAPATHGWPTGTQALSLLHSLASQPATAGDALKLLHELQVHQVELDLQHEQVELDRRTHAEALARYTALFNDAPFGYITLDAEGRVVEANRLGAAWLGGEPGDGNDHWTGCRLVDLVAADFRPAARDLLGALRQGTGRQTCMLCALAATASMQVAVTATAAADGSLLAFMPTAPAAAG